MPVKVIDASAMGALLFGESEAGQVANRLLGATLVAPLLLGFEVANICLKKLRRHPEQRVALLTAFDLQSRMRIEAVEVDHAEVLSLAERVRLTSYDASYLWLAHKLDAELVTLDNELQAAVASD